MDSLPNLPESVRCPSGDIIEENTSGVFPPLLSERQAEKTPSTISLWGGNFISAIRTPGINWERRRDGPILISPSPFSSGEFEGGIGLPTPHVRSVQVEYYSLGSEIFNRGPGENVDPRITIELSAELYKGFVYFKKDGGFQIGTKKITFTENAFTGYNARGDVDFRTATFDFSDGLELRGNLDNRAVHVGLKVKCDGPSVFVKMVAIQRIIIHVTL